MKIGRIRPRQLHPDERRWPRWTSYLGFFLCLVLAATLIAIGRGDSVPGS